MSIEGALNPLPGVDLATVDVDKATVTVEYDQTAISREDIVTAITEQGYDVPA
jgi:copper chaperone